MEGINVFSIGWIYRASIEKVNSKNRAGGIKGSGHRGSSSTCRRSVSNLAINIQLLILHIPFAPFAPPYVILPTFCSK
jgi:hypothetical protein